MRREGRGRCYARQTACVAASGPGRRRPRSAARGEGARALAALVGARCEHEHCARALRARALGARRRSERLHDRDSFGVRVTSRTRTCAVDAFQGHGTVRRRTDLSAATRCAVRL